MLMNDMLQEGTGSGVGSGVHDRDGDRPACEVIHKHKNVSVARGGGRQWTKVISRNYRPRSTNHDRVLLRVERGSSLVHLAGALRDEFLAVAPNLGPPESRCQSLVSAVKAKVS